MNSDARGIRANTLSVIVPTYREAANVRVLFERLKAALEGLPWEMIVVDGAAHEVMMERDLFRDQFWAAFDAFIPGVENEGAPT